MVFTCLGASLDARRLSDYVKKSEYPAYPATHQVLSVRMKSHVKDIDRFRKLTEAGQLFSPTRGD